MFDYYDCDDINDIARSEGFSIDDDGDWIPLEDNDDDNDSYYEDQCDDSYIDYDF